MTDDTPWLPAELWDRCTRRDLRRRPRTFVAQICHMYDVPVWLVTGGQQPRFHRIRWAIRRLTGYQGARR